MPILLKLSFFVTLIYNYLLKIDNFFNKIYNFVFIDYKAKTVLCFTFLNSFRLIIVESNIENIISVNMIIIRNIKQLLFKLLQVYR